MNVLHNFLCLRIGMWEVELCYSNLMTVVADAAIDEDG